MPQSPRRNVELGQRYRSRGCTFTVWEVETFLRLEDEPLAHVRLVRVGAPRDMKTVAAGCLADRNLYEVVD